MSLPGDLKMFGRFALGLRRFLRHTLSLDDARAVVRRCIEEREANFLRLVDKAVFGYPRSPYLPLFELAGCEAGDVRQLVRDNGLEGSLRALREAGIYATFEECKGRHPIVRGGREYPVQARDFDNPFLKAQYYSESSGTTGAGTRVGHELDHLAVVSAHEMLTYEAHRVLDVPKAMWRGVLPEGGGINNILRMAHYGRVPERWFSPVMPGELAHSLFKYRLATQLVIAAGRALGVPMPWPEPARLDRAEIVARWMADTVRTHGSCLMLAPASRALRVSVVAKEKGLDLTGAVFRIVGEPITPAKHRGITASGARMFTAYGFSEAGRLAMGCGRPSEPNDLHLLEGLCAVIQYSRLVPGTDITVPAFNVTTLMPTAPKILLNAESDDYGVMETRSCGCPLSVFGTTHLHGIYSFRKLTGEGMTLVGSEMIRILEEVLPSRFGGSALDYQMLEEEDEQGLTRLRLLVDPSVEIADEAEVIETVLSALAASSAMAHTARNIWKQAGTLRVKRAAPVWTARGKLMSLHVARAAGGVHDDRHA